MSQSSDKQSHNSSTVSSKGIGFGLFILLAGVVLLAERVGWLPAGTDWLFPAVLIAWGASELYQRLTGN